MKGEEEQTLIYVDMLGWSALNEEHPHRIETDDSLSTRGRTVVSTAPTQSQFNLFDRVLDCCINDRRFASGITAMLFSDCAFLNPGNSLQAALIATDLMRKFIEARVPVRMGIGKGTFYSFEYSMDTGGDSRRLVTKSRFLGTAVVRAAAAEKCGGKGMRIFVHPKVDDLNSHSRFKILKLPKPFKAANRELDYLCPKENQKEGEADRDLSKDVDAMESAAREKKNEREWGDIRIQYDETRSALNRMRKSHVRLPV